MEITATNLIIFMSGLIIITIVIAVAVYAIHREHQGDRRIIRRLEQELADAQAAVSSANSQIEQLNFDLSLTRQNRDEADEEVTLLKNRMITLTTELGLIVDQVLAPIREVRE